MYVSGHFYARPGFLLAASSPAGGEGSRPRFLGASRRTVWRMRPGAGRMVVGSLLGGSKARQSLATQDEGGVLKDVPPQ